MLAQSHRIFSIALVEFGLIATDSFLTHPASNIALLLATGIGASLPDIDQHNSKVSRKSPINFSMFLRHRGITHSLLGWIIFAVILYFLMNLLILYLLLFLSCELALLLAHCSLYKCRNA